MTTQQKNKKNSFLLRSLGIGIVLLAASLLIFGATKPERYTDTKEKTVETVETEVVHKERIDYFDTLVLEARAAHVFDIKKGETLFAKNIDQKLPLASLTKIMTAIVAQEIAPPDTSIPITYSALAQEGDAGLVLGEIWGLGDLTSLMLVASVNDAALAIMETLAPNDFVARMNEKAQVLGLTHTYFINVTGLDINDETKPGAYGSAQDVTKLFAYALEHIPDSLMATQKDMLTIVSKNNIPHIVENTNTNINATPWVLGSKTGFTDHAGGNLVVAFNAGLQRPIIVTVLGSNVEKRFSDVSTLINATIRNVAQ